jgi:hypothetical protein
LKVEGFGAWLLVEILTVEGMPVMVFLTRCHIPPIVPVDLQSLFLLPRV